MVMICTVCRHKSRAAIDRALVSGGPSLRAVARQFATSKDALARHKASCLVATVAKATAAAEVVEVAHGGALLEQVRQLQAEALRRLGSVDADDPRGAAALLREARGCLDLQGKLLGEFAKREAGAPGRAPGSAPIDAPPEIEALWPAAHAGDERAMSQVARWLVSGSTDPTKQIGILRRMVVEAEAELPALLVAAREVAP